MRYTAEFQTCQINIICSKSVFLVSRQPAPLPTSAVLCGQTQEDPAQERSIPEHRGVAQHAYFLETDPKCHTSSLPILLIFLFFGSRKFSDLPHWVV